MTKFNFMQDYVNIAVSEAIRNPTEENVEFAKLTEKEWEDWKDRHSLSECE